MTVATRMLENVKNNAQTTTGDVIQFRTVDETSQSVQSNTGSRPRFAWVLATLSKSPTRAAMSLPACSLIVMFNIILSFLFYHLYNLQHIVSVKA